MTVTSRVDHPQLRYLSERKIWFQRPILPQTEDEPAVMLTNKQETSTETNTSRNTHSPYGCNQKAKHWKRRCLAKNTSCISELLRLVPKNRGHTDENRNIMHCCRGCGWSWWGQICVILAECAVVVLQSNTKKDVLMKCRELRINLPSIYPSIWNPNSLLYSSNVSKRTNIFQKWH